MHKRHPHDSIRYQLTREIYSLQRLEYEARQMGMEELAQAYQSSILRLGMQWIATPKFLKTLSDIIKRTGNPRIRYIKPDDSR